MKRLRGIKLRYLFYLIAGILLVSGGCECQHMIDAFLKGVYYVIIDFDQCKLKHQESGKTAFRVYSCLYFCHRLRNRTGFYTVDVTLHLDGLNGQGHYTANYTYVEELTTNRDEFGHEEYGVTIDEMEAGSYKVWAEAEFNKINGNDHFILTTPSFCYLYEAAGGGSNSFVYSIQAITDDSCVTVRVGEKTDIPYTLPILFRTLYDDNPQNGITVNFSLDNTPPPNGYLTPTTLSGYFLNQEGIAQVVFQPDNTGEAFIKATAEANNSLQVWDRVRVEVIEDEEESGLPFAYTHRRAFYPDGPEIKGDGFDDYWEDPDPQHKDVWVEIDTIAGWGIYYPGYDLDIIKNVAQKTLESAVLASTTPGIETDFSTKYPSGIKVYFKDEIEGIWVDWQYLTLQEAKELLASHRDYKNAIHVIIAYLCGSPDYTNIPGLTLYLDRIDEGNIENNSAVWSAIWHSLGPRRRAFLDSTGIVIFYGPHKGDQSVLPPLRDSLMGFVLAHEIGHALGMTHVCGSNTAKDNKEEGWYKYACKLYFGNVMYPKINTDITYIRDTLFVRMNHFLIQSSEDSNDWQEAEDPNDITNLRFIPKAGYPGICTRDVLGINNTSIGLLGWLLWKKEQGGL